LIPKSRLLLRRVRDIVTATGKVAWINEFSVGDRKTDIAYRAGIDFISVDGQDQEKVAKYVTSRLPRRRRIFKK